MASTAALADVIADAKAAAIAEGRKTANAYCLEIIELCLLAGFPARAPGFMRAGTSVKEVRALLQDARADASEMFETRGHLAPYGMAAAAKEADAGWDRAIAIATNKIVGEFAGR